MRNITRAGKLSYSFLLLTEGSRLPQSLFRPSIATEFETEHDSDNGKGAATTRIFALVCF